MKIVIFSLLVFLVSIHFVLLRKKKKKAKPAKKPQDPLSRKPEKIQPELYCDACIAMIKETTKELRGKKKESDVIEALESVCNPEKYYTYRILLFIFRSPSPRNERRM